MDEDGQTTGIIQLCLRKEQPAGALSSQKLVVAADNRVTKPPIHHFCAYASLNFTHP